MRFIRSHMSTFLVALVTAAVTAGSPAIADGVRHALFAHDSDKVDGKHAVGSSASKASRKGKLVATNPRTGYLPNNIILKALNSAKLGGAPASSYLTTSDSIDWSQLISVPADVVALGNGAALGNSVTAPNFLFSDPKTLSVFADPTDCQRGLFSEDPYVDVRVFNPPGSNLEPAIGISNSTAGDYDFYCPIKLGVAEGSTLAITGGDVQFADFQAGCLASAHLSIRNFGAVGVGAQHASVFSGTSASDFAFISPDGNGRVDKSWTGLGITVGSSTIPYIRVRISNDGTPGTDCRYHGAIVRVTVNQA